MSGIISNSYIGNDSTHSGNSIKTLPRKIAEFFFMDVIALEFPLNHPEFVLPDRSYDSKYYKIIYPNIFIRTVRVILQIIKRCCC